MAGMLELSDQDFFFFFKINLRILNGKGDNTQEQMSNVSTEMTIFREKMLLVKNIVTEMKNLPLSTPK